MKKTLILFGFIIGFSGFSQIKVLKNESLNEIGSDNSVGLFKKENKYTIHYQDRNVGNLNTFRSFTFLDVNKDVEGLYKLLSDGFIDMPSSDISLELPNDILDLHFEKNYGQPTVQFVQYINKNKKFVGKSPFLTKKQIDKIFGKSTGKSVVYEKGTAKPQVAQNQGYANPAPVETAPEPVQNSTPAKKGKRK
jgi:hypothetical protein